MEFAREIQVPPLYGEPVIESLTGEFLSITGGTMTGPINMNGNKITNLGQLNLQDGDAVNLLTVKSLVGQSKTEQSMSISTKTGTSSITAGELPEITILPGILTFGGLVNSTNWSNPSTSLYDGYVIGANNIPGLPSTATIKAIFRMISSASVTVKLTLLLTSTSSVIGTSSVVVPANDPSDFTIELPTTYNKDLELFDQYVINMYIEATTPFNVTHRLIALYYVLSFD